MPLPRVYADFNAIECPPNAGHAEMPLTGYGTLASLARQHLRLSEGMSLVLFEPNDIECVATVHFDCGRTDPVGRQGEWVARFNHLSVQDCTQEEEPGTEKHPCIVCGAQSFGQKHSRTYTELCSVCGASVMEPMLPPHSAT